MDDRGRHDTLDRSSLWRPSRLSLGGLRILMGLLFSVTWVENLSKGLYGSDYVPFLEGRAAQNSIGLYADFLRTVVIPNATLFRSAQFVTELVVMGLCLLAGFLTPVASVIAGFFVLNLLLSSLGVPGEWWGTYVLMLGVLAALAYSRAGRTAGVDGWLVRRFGVPRLPLY